MVYLKNIISSLNNQVIGSHFSKLNDNFILEKYLYYLWIEKKMLFDLLIKDIRCYHPSKRSSFITSLKIITKTTKKFIILLLT